MRKLKSLKYLVVLILPVLTWHSFNTHGWQTFLPFIYIFVCIPGLELLLKPDDKNIAKTAEKSLIDDVFYDLQVYATVPVQLFTLGYFLFSVGVSDLAIIDKAGRILSMGLCCGVFGINVGHELGHRRKAYERWLAKIHLMTSLNMHFMHEHNNHHHKAVSTPEDPATARYNEPLYLFWIRSMTGVYAMAWKLERDRLKRQKVSFFSWQNQMITDTLIQLVLLISIGIFFGVSTVGYFVVAALIGHLLLETINYIEHYGLMRHMIGERYERVTPKHSWNSDHRIGRIHLFELSRHSDHHFRPGRKYQILRHMEESPQMPTGYPGMMILATLPPLWFAVMNKRVHAITVGNEMRLSK
ncbi:MAG: alkane 1-monooxygenase [Flavobacteriales bacterium]|nr:alkane 1-monooxygenase [Flavobacteriales bacterium]